MGEHTKWFRYVDDVLLITPVDTSLQEMLASLNRVHDRIQFTLEQKDKLLTFLDTSIIIEDKSVRFTVFRKPTNRVTYIHFSLHTS